MDIFKIILIAILAVSLILIIKQSRPELALIVSLAAIVVIFIFSIDKIGQVVELLKELSMRAGMPNDFLEVILKITGVAYITEFGANLCKDAGESAIASKIQFAGKAIILTFGITIIGNFIDTITKII